MLNRASPLDSEPAVPSAPSLSLGRDRVVACALEVLRDLHPDELSIREVSRRAGVSSGAPYHHFGDRHGLLAACAEVGWTQLTAQLRDVDTASPLAVQIRSVATVYFSFAMANPGLYRLMMSGSSPNAAARHGVDDMRALAMATVTGRLDATEGDVAGRKSRGIALWSLMHGYIMLRLDRAVTGGSDPQAQLDALIESMVDLSHPH